jgi:hypothetical protein
VLIAATTIRAWATRRRSLSPSRLRTKLLKHLANEREHLLPTGVPRPRPSGRLRRDPRALRPATAAAARATDRRLDQQAQRRTGGRCTLNSAGRSSTPGPTATA